MSTIKIIGNWVAFFIVLAVVVLGVKWVYQNVEIPRSEFNLRLPGYLVLLFGFSIAFVWVEILKWFKRVKPFNCLKCMTGWVCLVLAFFGHTPYWYFYIFVGVTVGAIFSALKMRYL